MNRIMSRARILMVLVLILAVGIGWFTAEFVATAHKWIRFPGSPHVYYAGNLGCGRITDRDNILLLDMTGERAYSSNSLLRKAALHWIGDRQGNISAPAAGHYAQQLLDYSVLDGLYSYGGGDGQVRMSLSAKVQMAAMEALGEYHGTIAVYNYKTGEILCAVTNPTYDPDNAPEEATDGLYLNRFTQATYTPGSIFKLVTAAAALESIPDILDRTFTCTGKLEYGIDKVTCFMPHGTLDLKGALGESCNCCFAQIADLLGEEVLDRYIRQFKVTEQVSFDGITTAQGSTSVLGEADVEVAWSAIGQHKDLVNPCAYLQFVGAIAAGGNGIEPYVVSEVISGGKTTYEAQPTASGRIMSAQTAKLLCEWMRNNVVNHYEGEVFGDLPVCAKTGTAEVGPGIKETGTFTGFLDDENYPLAFIAVVEKGGSGHDVCIPMINTVLRACIEVLDGK